MLTSLFVTELEVQYLPIQNTTVLDRLRVVQYLVLRNRARSIPPSQELANLKVIDTRNFGYIVQIYIGQQRREGFFFDFLHRRRWRSRQEDGHFVRSQEELVNFWWLSWGLRNLVRTRESREADYNIP